MGGLFSNNDERGRALDDGCRREEADGNLSSSTSRPTSTSGSPPSRSDSFKRSLEETVAILRDLTEEELNRPIERGYKPDLPDLSDLLQGDFFQRAGNNSSVQASTPQVPPPPEPHI